MKTLKTLLAWPFRSCSHPSRPARPSPRRAGRRGMLTIECLEDRTAPAALSVTSAADTHQAGRLTLREAVAQANADAGRGQSDTIGFAASLGTATVTLTGGQLELSGASGSATETIDGGGRIAVSGNNASRVFQIDAGVHAALAGLAITQGSVAGAAATGGGVYTAGSTVLISDCTLSNNQALGNAGGAGSGGGLYVAGGSVTIEQSTLSANHARGGQGAGGHFHIDPHTGQIVYDSPGGPGGSGYGGGIYLAGGTVAVNQSTLSADQATGGSGGPGAPYGPAGAGFGGGIYLAGGSVAVNQSTVAADQASGGGGGGGGGIYNLSGTLTARNSLVAGNSSVGSAPDVSGAADARSGYNLIGNGSGLSGINNGVNGNRVGTAASPLDPRLALLGDYGGPTQTMALRPGSPAIGTGDPTGAPDWDQRGPGFPRVVNGTIDIGAYEVQTVRGPGTFHVTSLLDAGAGSGLSGDLRHALNQVNAGPGGDTIVFDVRGTIALGRALPALGAGVDVRGPGPGSLTISGNHALRVLTVNAGVTVHLADVTIADGFASDGTFHGGGIDNAGTLTLSSCTLSGNRSDHDGGGIFNGGTLTVSDCTLSANSGENGGGIYNQGMLTVSSSTFAGNSATNYLGGAIDNGGGTLTVSSSTFAGNSANVYGGGIYNFGGTLTLSSSTFTGNSGGSSGGAVYNDSGHTLMVSCTFARNSASIEGGGGIYNSGTLTVSSSTFAGNYTPDGEGGGIYNRGTLTASTSTFAGNSADNPDGEGGGIYNGAGDTLTVSSSTFTGNSAHDYGGGIHNFSGTVTVSTSTFTGNSAGPVGGGIYSDGTLTVSSSTFARNSANADGGGIFNDGTLRVSDTAVAGNSASGSGSDISGASVDPRSSYNLIGNGTGLFGLSDGVNGNRVGTAASPIDPRLAPLGNYGGPTQTFALLPGSPARAAGDPALTGTDQRGFPRPAGGPGDAGAFQTQANPFRVTTAADPGRLLGLLALREALNLANALPGSDTITFNLPGTGAQTIDLASALPTVTRPVVIDGTTQPGYAGQPLIELNGAGAGPTANGLTITAGNTLVTGLAIDRFRGTGVVLQTGGGNALTADYLGTDPAGTAARGNGLGGVAVVNSSGNTIGAAGNAGYDLISGNGGPGIALSGAGATGNLVLGNFVGTDASGSYAVGNAGAGIAVSGGAANNVVGTSAAGGGNLVSGNGGPGVSLDGPGTRGNVVRGNFVGTDASGTAALGNGGAGVAVTGAAGNTIGGAAAGEGNVVSANLLDGIALSGAAASGNRVLGNYVGTDAYGSFALGNGGNGVAVVAGAHGNTVGAAGNVGYNLVSGNGGAGIALGGSGATGNAVVGNFVGTDASGSYAVGNAGAGIAVSGGAANNVVGTSDAGGGNLVSGNGGPGVSLDGPGTAGNVLRENFVGTDASGSYPVGNGGAGVSVSGAANNTIGGTGPWDGNVVSGNSLDGVVLSGAGASGNRVLGNLVGTDASGSYSVGNGGNGVAAVAGAHGNAVGGAAAGAGNTIAFNGADGVLVDGGAGNAVLHDLIFANANLGIELVNGGNNGQAAPALTSASSAGGVTTVAGTLAGQPSSTYTLELFAADPANPQGELFLGAVTVTTDASGAAAFTLTFGAAVPPGWAVTATATDAGNDTSAFSAGVVVGG